jgi:LmbE family N-acetylglucosaminyl deacetylase
MDRPTSSSGTDGCSPEPVCGVGAMCLPGATERRACGACATGVEERQCDETCVFGAWGSCRGEDGALPVEPRSHAPVCGPYERPAVFFAPHPDDETLGMAGAIREQLVLGRPVFIELMTHGEASAVRRQLNNGRTDNWHTGAHDYSLSEAAFGDARVQEFMRAAIALGVTGIYVSGFGNGKLKSEDVKTRVDYWIARGGTGLGLNGTAGEQDPREPEGKPHPDHDAVWRALAASGAHDVRAYCIYGLTTGKCSPARVSDVSPWCDDKRAALAAYRDWEPEHGRFAIGYHSVPELFDRAATRCEELVVELQDK